jgi:hypothetical protein
VRIENGEKQKAGEEGRGRRKERVRKGQSKRQKAGEEGRG